MIRKIKKELINQFPFFVGIPALIWQVIFFFIPLLFVFYMSIRWVDPVLGVKYFSLKNYVMLFDRTYFFIIARSFFFGLLNALLSIFFAYPIAYFISVVVQRFKLFWLFLLLVPFWTNFLLHVYAWFFILEKGGVVNTFLMSLGLISEPLQLLNSMPAVVLVMFYSYLPFMTLPIYSILDKLDLSLLEASADLGATRWQTFFRVTLPMTLPGLQLGFFLVFVPTFGEFAIPALVGGDKKAFAGSLISFLFLEGGNQPLASAFTVISIICIIVAALGFYHLSNFFIYRR